jgi:hypothetical protein
MPSDTHVSQFGLNMLWPVQAVGHWLFTASAAVLSEICPCGMRVGKKGKWHRFFSLYFVIPQSDIPPVLQIHHHHHYQL